MGLLGLRIMAIAGRHNTPDKPHVPCPSAQQVETRQTGVERELPGGEVEHLGTTVSWLQGWLCQPAKDHGLHTGGGVVGHLGPQ